MDRKAIESLCRRTGFRPFRILTATGQTHDITDIGRLALGQSELFFYLPGTDRSVRIAYAQINEAHPIADR